MSDLTEGMREIPWPSKRPRKLVPPGPGFDERRRRDAWYGLFGCAVQIVDGRNQRERDCAAKRMVEYVDRLKALGVEPPKEER